MKKCVNVFVEWKLMCMLILLIGNCVLSSRLCVLLSCVCVMSVWNLMVL